MDARRTRALLLTSILGITLLIPAPAIAAPPSPQPSATAKITVNARDCATVVINYTVTWAGFAPNAVTGPHEFTLQAGSYTLASQPPAFKDRAGDKTKGSVKGSFTRSGYFDHATYPGLSYSLLVEFGAGGSTTVTRSPGLLIPACVQ